MKVFHFFQKLLMGQTHEHGDLVSPWKIG